MCTVVLSSFVACSCVSSAVALYSSVLRQMSLKEILQIRKCWVLDIFSKKFI